MWKPAFGAGYQAPRGQTEIASVGTHPKVLGASFPQRIREFCPFLLEHAALGPVLDQIVDFRKAAQKLTSPDSCTELEIKRLKRKKTFGTSSATKVLHPVIEAR
jgi:hypothetical protein